MHIRGSKLDHLIDGADSPHDGETCRRRYSCLRWRCRCSMGVVLSLKCVLAGIVFYTSVVPQCCLANNTSKGITISAIVEIPGTESNSHFRAMNDAGISAGYMSSNPHDPPRPLIASENGLVDMSTRLGSDCEIAGINNRGELIYSAYISWQTEVAWLWSNGRKVRMRAFGGRRSSASGINNGGVAVGCAEKKNGDLHAFMYANSKMLDLGTLGGATSAANSINDCNQVVGAAEGRDGLDHAFLWQFGKMQELPSLSQASAYATSINNVGDIVGFAGTRTVTFVEKAAIDHAVFWHAGKIVDIQTIPCMMSYACGINDCGVVIGNLTYYNGSPGNWKYSGFLWYAGKMVDINNLLPRGSGYKVEGIRAINNRNQVLAWAHATWLLIQLQLSDSGPVVLGQLPYGAPRSAGGAHVICRE